MHPEHDPKLQKTDNANETIKTDDYTCEETKTADLPMDDQKVAESGEQTDYIPRRSNRNRTVIEPQAGSEAVKVVTMGNRCSRCANCVCAHNRLGKISIACTKVAT